jgi:hypothetical protein
MPLHISEIGVRLAVGGTPAPSPAPAPAAGSGHGPGGGGQAGAIPPDKIDEIVSLSAQRVLEQLRAIEAR